MIANAKMHSDQNGDAGIDISAAIALRDAATIPMKRPKPPPANSDAAAINWTMPINSVIQPQVCRPLTMYVTSSVKNLESLIAAMPQMMSRTPAIASRSPAKTHQPVTRDSLPMSSLSWRLRGART